MKMARKKILFSTLVLLVGVGVVFAWTALPNASRWERGYSQIAEGDSEEKVLDIVGRPTEIKDCDDLRYSRPEIWQKCAEEYSYSAFMQEWGYVISKEGRVLLKWHSVS